MCNQTCHSDIGHYFHWSTFYIDLRRQCSQVVLRPIKWHSLVILLSELVYEPTCFYSRWHAFCLYLLSSKSNPVRFIQSTNFHVNDNVTFTVIQIPHISYFYGSISNSPPTHHSARWTYPMHEATRPILGIVHVSSSTHRCDNVILRRNGRRFSIDMYHWKRNGNTVFVVSMQRPLSLMYCLVTQSG